MGLISRVSSRTYRDSQIKIHDHGVRKEVLAFGGSRYGISTKRYRFRSEITTRIPRLEASMGRYRWKNYEPSPEKPRYLVCCAMGSWTIDYLRHVSTGGRHPEP